MVDLNGILHQLGGIAGSITDAIVPGASNLVKAGEAIVKAFDTVKTANDGDAPADAQVKLDALLDKVNAHADSTLGRLEGGD